MFPDRRTKPWLRTPGLIIVAVVYVLGVVVTALATWATFKYVAPPSRLIEAAFVAVVLIIVGLLLIRHGVPSLRGSLGSPQPLQPAS